MDNGPYDDHLRRHLWNISRKPSYAKVMKQIINNEVPDDTLTCNKLRAAGLITGTGANIKTSFLLYKLYFMNKL